MKPHPIHFNNLVKKVEEGRWGGGGWEQAT